MAHMMLSGLGDAAAADVASVSVALRTAGGAAAAAKISKKFYARSEMEAAKADIALKKMVIASNTPPTNAAQQQAAKAHDEFVKAATASGRLSIAGNFLGQAAVLHAQAASAALNAPAARGNPGVFLAQAQAAAVGAQAAVSVPVPVMFNLPPMRAAAAMTAQSPIAAAGPLPGTIPQASGAPALDRIVANPTAVGGGIRPPSGPRLMVPIGWQAQVFGRAAGIGTALPASLAPYKSGAQAPTMNMPPGYKTSSTIGQEAWRNAPNPRFYSQNKFGAPVGTVAAFRGGGLSGFGADPLALVLNAARSAASGATQGAANAGSNAMANATGSSPAETNARTVALAFYAALGRPTMSVIGSVYRNTGWVIYLQDSADGARASAVVLDADSSKVRSHALAKPGDAGYNTVGANDHINWSAPTTAQTTLSTGSSGGGGTPAQNPNAPLHCPAGYSGTVATGCHPHSASGGDGGGDSSTGPSPSDQGSSGAPTASWWGGLSTTKKALVGAGGAVALVIGAKLLL